MVSDDIGLSGAGYLGSVLCYIPGRLLAVGPRPSGYLGRLLVAGVSERFRCWSRNNGRLEARVVQESADRHKSVKSCDVNVE